MTTNTASVPTPDTSGEQVRADAPGRRERWPLWLLAAGALGTAATVFLDNRADSGKDDYTVTEADMQALDHVAFRIGGMVGYLAVACLLVAAALWHRRVVQRHTESLAAPVVGFGLAASAAALALAYGWKGALGDYLHGAMEEGTYDDQGLYTYYVMNDFSPFIGWVPAAVALLAIGWMGLREGLVSRPLGCFAGGLGLLLLAAVAVTGVPGLPFGACVGLVVVGTWLLAGNSAITRAPA